MTPTELAREFDAAPARIASALFDVFRDTAEDTVEEWRDNVRATSPQGHLKHLPNAITAEMRLGTSIIAEMGPESGRRQGRLGLGDELGSRNQPPHLNGMRAVAANTMKLDKRADAAIGLALP